MPRMSKKRKHELSLYLNDRGRVTYNELCRKCPHGCKQSFRAVVIDCRYRSCKPLIATTNLTLEELQHPQDTPHARIYDRLT